MTVKCFKYGFFIFAMALLSVAANNSVYAAAPSSCDPAFGEVMKSHAWMAASREVETAQRLILKPDSVLQYSCFQEQLATAASFNSFRESAAGIALVGGQHSAYLGSNFNHAAGANTTGIGPDICYSMAVVWGQMKCRDFNKADFVTFEDLAGNDRRVFPEPCSAEAVAARNENWAFNLEVANPPPSYPSIGGSIERSSDPRYHLELMSWSDGECGAPIRTGVLQPGGEYDAVCPLPGCTFTGSSCR